MKIMNKQLGIVVLYFLVFCTSCNSSENYKKIDYNQYIRNKNVIFSFFAETGNRKVKVETDYFGWNFFVGDCIYENNAIWVKPDNTNNKFKFVDFGMKKSQSEHISYTYRGNTNTVNNKEYNLKLENKYYHSKYKDSIYEFAFENYSYKHLHDTIYMSISKKKGILNVCISEPSLRDKKFDCYKSYKYDGDSLDVFEFKKRSNLLFFFDENPLSNRMYIALEMSEGYSKDTGLDGNLFINNNVVFFNRFDCGSFTLFNFNDRIGEKTEISLIFSGDSGKVKNKHYEIILEDKFFDSNRYDTIYKYRYNNYSIISEGDDITFFIGKQIGFVGLYESVECHNISGYERISAVQSGYLYPTRYDYSTIDFDWSLK